MPLSLEQKKNLVKEVADVVANADTLLTADFRGLTANELVNLEKLPETLVYSSKLSKITCLRWH